MIRTKTALWVVMTLGILLTVAVSGAMATTWDVGADFSASNPNGAWSYGFAGSNQGQNYTFVLYDLYVENNNGPNDLWRRAFNISEPGVWHNDSGVAYNDGNSTTPATGVGMHPGPEVWADWGDVSVVRWTAPSAGTYEVAATWYELWNGSGTTTDVHLRHNRVSLFDSRVFPYWLGGPGSTSTTMLLNLAQGDTIDFTVGTGNGNYGGDPTGLNATITSIVPEPSSLAALALGLIGAAGAAIRRKR